MAARNYEGAVTLNKKRQEFIKNVYSHLTGKGLELPGNILNSENPLDRFFTGFLFPILEAGEGTDDGLEEIEEIIENGDDQTKATAIVRNKRYIPPSSAGFSFFVSGSSIKLRIFYDAIFYKKSNLDNNSQSRNEKGQYSNVWERTTLTDNGGEELEFTPNSLKKYDIFEYSGTNKGRVEVIWRPYSNGYIVTVTLLNIQQLQDMESHKEYVRERNEKTLFNVELSCIIESGELHTYPAKDRSLLSAEEQEIELRYKDQHVYAVGHGTAGNWKKNSENKWEIFADFMPEVEVPQVTANVASDDKDVLSFYYLSESPQELVIDQLTRFIHEYENWISDQEQQADNETLEDKPTADSILKKQKTALKRMEHGVRLLENDEYVWRAFTTMNLAMLMQWKVGKPGSHNEDFSWRPFQLAFILMTLESTVNNDSAYRDTVDLIWFPTGGGKTEAYLGLMGFLFLYRRLKYPASSGGTIAIMRYTLRLLTTQQFLRANKVIFALEIIRRENQDLYGNEPFTSGLWVGGESSPNTFHKAKQIIDREQYSKLVLTRCPWCNQKLQPQNYCVTDDSFHFTCTNKECFFGKENNNVLPCNIVDESLYKDPPTLLLATVDKFARLAWENRAGVFFGDKRSRPPELIIQDELHLISSALGSIVGLYEAGIDTALIVKGMRSKYVASTATIKHASKQVKSLFAREMQVFPPSGLRYNDSYFAKTIPLKEKPGRLYVGYLAPLLSKQDCMSPLAASLLASPIELFSHEEQYMDNWWTKIVYHSSLKSVNNSRTLYMNQIETRLNRHIVRYLRAQIEEEKPGLTKGDKLERLTDFEKFKDPEIQQLVKRYLPVREIKIKALTSNQTAEENAEIFNQLAKKNYEPQSIDIALATNMISVGLDVSRLALMIINGQPLTTAEYIQASSRIGRGETPGIVYVNFHKTQARSLSHYENFRSYHDAFYRYVEPSSLTPFTYQARQRALHAALVIAIRHSGIGLLHNKGAEEFNSQADSVKKVVSELKLRCKYAAESPKEYQASTKNIDLLLGQWQKYVEYCNEQSMNLVYYSNDRGEANLLSNFDEKNGLWKTLNSMRNVENTAFMKLLPAVRQCDE